MIILIGTEKIFYKIQHPFMLKNNLNQLAKVKVIQSGLTLCDRAPGQNTGVGSRSLPQGIFLTQELNWGLHSSTLAWKIP